MHCIILFLKSSFYLTCYIKFQQLTLPFKQMLIGRKVRVHIPSVSTRLSKCSTGNFYLYQWVKQSFRHIPCLTNKTRWVALMIQLEQQQHGEFVCGGVVADTNYLYPARWGWNKIFLFYVYICRNVI